jgi:hypothetical protein
MKFTRENFELFVIDYLEGKLTDHDNEMFLQFLRENPDIKYAVEEIKKIQLEPIDIKFNDKNNLKKNSGSLKFDSEFEDLCIALFEGDLEPPEKEKFESWLSENPDKLIEFELFRKSRVKPDINIVFNPKLKLKRLTLVQRRIRLISAISAAAVIILVIIFTVNKNYLSNDLVAEKPATNLKVQPDTEVSGAANIANGNDYQYLDNQSNVRELSNDSREVEQGNKQVDFGIKNNNVKTGKYFSKPDDLSESVKEQIEIQPVSSLFATVENKNFPGLNNLRKSESGSDMKYDSYQTLAQYAGNKILKSLMAGNDSIVQAKITFWDIASSGFKELNQITDGGYALDTETDRSGKIKRLSFETPLIGFSIPIKNRQPQ